MKCTTVIDAGREEEVVLYLHRENGLSDKIRTLLAQNEVGLIGYAERTVVKLDAEDIFCFTIEDCRVLARTQTESFRLKQRLYELEELFGKDFVKINQSCMVNVRQIARFDATIGGALMVTLKNGYRDYVSRRQLKEVKERIGFTR